MFRCPWKPLPAEVPALCAQKHNSGQRGCLGPGARSAQSNGDPRDKEKSASGFGFGPHNQAFSLRMARGEPAPPTLSSGGQVNLIRFLKIQNSSRAFTGGDRAGESLPGSASGKGSLRSTSPPCVLCALGTRSPGPRGLLLRRGLDGGCAGAGTGCLGDRSPSILRTALRPLKGKSASFSRHPEAASEVLCCYRFQKVSVNEPDISLTQNNPFKRKVRNNCYFLFFSPPLYCYNDFA